MFTPKSRHASLRQRRSVLPLLLALAVPLALAACNGGDNPLAPTSEPAAEPVVGASVEPAAEPAAASYVLAAGTSQRIVFESYRNGQGDIYKMDPQGSNVAQLTKTADADMRPAWSWDNTHTALVRARQDASNISHTDIYVINADGSNGHWARPTPFPYNLTDPAWSPDGSRIVLRVSIGSSSYIGWMDVATGNVGLFNAATGGVLGYQPQYDKVGQRIIYLGSTYKTVEQMNADGSGRKTRISSATMILGPTFSPDGKRIAYSKEPSDDNMEIFVKNLTDGTTKRLTNSAGSDVQPSWSPDGSKIAFASRRTGQYQIWTMPASGGSPTRITHTTTTEVAPAWSH